jgi:hypothetical protein
MDDLNCKLLSVKIYDRDSGLDSYSRVSSSSLDCSSPSSLSCRVRRLRDNVRVTRRRSAMLRASSVPVIRVIAPYLRCLPYNKYFSSLGLINCVQSGRPRFTHLTRASCPLVTTCLVAPLVVKWMVIRKSWVQVPTEA